MGTSERTLLRRAHRGHDASARELWASLSPRLLSLARLLVRDRVIDAEDVVQQAFCRMLERPRAEIRSVEHPFAWMSAIVRSVALNARRADAREQDRRSGRESIPPDPAHPDGDRGLLDALDRLDDADRELLVLKHTTGLSFDLLAEVVGQNRNTLASRHRAAVARLRAVLGGESVESDGASPRPIEVGMIQGSRP